MKIIIVFLVSLFFGVMPQQAVAGSEVALYLDAARMSMQNEDWEQAEDRLLKVIGLEFNDVTARYQLGKVAEERGELRLAIKRYKMVVFLDKNNQPALLGWARVAEKLHSDDVLIVYQRLMKLQPDKVLWHLKVAQFYMQHKPSSAKRYISQVLKINPNHRQGLELMIAYQKKYMLIAHDAPFQRRLDKLDALNKVTPAVLASHVSVVAEKVIEPGLECLPEQMVDDHALQLEPEVIALVDMQFAAEESSDVSIFQYYLKQAKRGGADDQYMLGLMYHEGRGVVQNDKQAVMLIKQAAVQGLAKAQCTLGMMLYEAIGGNKKEKEAMQWLMRAAKQGVVDAQYALGLIYTTHHRFKDHGKAVKWWKVAAAQQDTRAQHNLAVMCFKGQGAVF